MLHYVSFVGVANDRWFVSGVKEGVEREREGCGQYTFQ